MSDAVDIFSIRPAIQPVLDPDFIPPVLAGRAFADAVKRSGKRTRILLALEREAGHITRGDLDVFAPGSGRETESLRFLERHLKFILWAWGGWKLHIAGPAHYTDAIRRIYSRSGERAFDAETMEHIYDRPMEVLVTDPDHMPASDESGSPLGGHTDGCRIGFDLGASDYKLAAVVDGTAVFSDEFPWNPKSQADPEYHYQHLNEGLRKAAAYMPRVDAIGGSSAGILVNSRIKVASLFRSVPRSEWPAKVTPMFERLRHEWKVPLEVANDGDVTALAGAMSLGRNSILGVAMGSSEAAGFLDARGVITGCLNELAFAPVDMNPAAAKDEWSGDHGVGAMYFSQQAVNKLLPAAGITLPATMELPERLKEAQNLVKKGHNGARQIFESIGVYLGYTIPWYDHYYHYENILILGRVTSGEGGDIVLNKAREVLAGEFPEVAERIALHVPDEKTRRVGQAVAAASLPVIH